MSNNGMNGFDERLELAQGSVFGFRSWSFSENLRLLHGAFGQPWFKGVNHAQCLGMPHKDNHPQVPSRDCGCGFWAYWQTGNSGLDIGGVIEGYGKTLIGSKGFRAEKAEIRGLTILNKVFEFDFMWTTSNITWTSTSSSTPYPYSIAGGGSGYYHLGGGGAGGSGGAGAQPGGGSGGGGGGGGGGAGGSGHVITGGSIDFTLSRENAEKERERKTRLLTSIYEVEVFSDITKMLEKFPLTTDYTPKCTCPLCRKT